MSILGNRVLRKEDPRFLRGEATYVENLPLEGALTITFVRSLLAHARVVGVDTSAAEALPDVQVFTGDDIDVTTGPPPIPVLEQRMRRPVVAKDVVRFVGDIVAVVVSPDRATGVDAAELVSVEYDPLPIVVDMVEAAKDEVILYPEVGTNVAGRAGRMDHDQNLFEGCDVVVSDTIVSQRMAGCPLEVRSAAAQVDADGRVTAWLSTQVPHRDHFGLTATLGMEPGQLRVIAPDVGGGFGAKSAFGAEETLIVWLARHLGKPVRWTETRSESMIALPHGRGQRLELKLGGTRDGKLLAYRIDILADTGAYPGVGAFLPNLTGLLSSGVYAIPRIEVEGLSVVTNTTPMTTIRGAGRPEAAQAIERMVDLFASEIDMDPAELRRKNFIAKDAFPYQTASGATYDSGDYEGALDLALRSVGYEELRAEQQRLRDEGGMLELGIGISSYTEITNPLGEEEYGEVEITADGGAIVHTGSFSHGQGHETTFAMIAGERLGLPIEKITVVKGDTDDVPRGTGTFGSKSTQIGGMAARGAADEVVERAKGLVGDYLEASAADVVLDTALGRFHVVGTPQARALVGGARRASGRRRPARRAEGAARLQGASDVPVRCPRRRRRGRRRDREGRAPAPRRRRRRGDARQSADRRGPGARRRLHRGRAGPLRGVRVRRRGKPAHGHARRLCVPVVRGPSRLGGDRDGDADAANELGAKGIGESGTVGATPAVWNAVLDALSPYGVRHVDMPCNGENVWRALQEAKA